MPALKRLATAALLGLMLIASAPADADTRIGNANPTSQQLWSFFHLGQGETKVTLSWTNANANLLMVLVCGTADPQSFGVAAGGLNRYAEIVSGVVPNQTCLVGVSSTRGTSAYRIHFNQAVSEVSQGRGRQPLDRAEDDRALRWYAQQQLDRLRLKAEAP